MVLSRPNKQIYDPIRKRLVEATPEEVVRQKLISWMLNDLQYPRVSLVVEKKLSTLVSNIRIPNRRLDILCLDTRSLHPLLLVECKATPIDENMLIQVMGYNLYIGAPLICLVNQYSIFLKWQYRDLPQKKLPTYLELIHACI